uniref:Antitoxin n=1 Tax=Streptococcus pneumoniae TaxID=1313 RepID=I0J960_STREE|nr:putative toxin-antitoxin system, antitoxin component, PHD family protein [Streptococcus pneumoniae]
MIMQINLENLVSITEANQNFSKVARMVDSKGTAVILKNNKPKYILVDYNTLIQEEQTEAIIADQRLVLTRWQILFYHAI